MAQLPPDIEHIVRRAAFGVSASEVDTFANMSADAAVDYFVDYEGRPDDVDEKIGRPDFAQVSTNNAFTPETDIDDARQRWLFRMIHTKRPLQEKMALFWHNHFATAFSKITADSGNLQAAKMFAHKPGALRGPQGQYELFRANALGNFRDLLFQVAVDPAMLIWLDGKFNTRAKPQENFGREIMELFTVGVDHYTEPDVYAAARVFSGWNIRKSEGYNANDPNSYQEFVYNADQHEVTSKTFSFPIYGDGGRTIPARSESAGMQDGLDLITALAMHPDTARRLARKFWSFFVSDVDAPDPAFIDGTAAVYLQNRSEIRPVVRYILTSPWFTGSSARFARYSWPAEFVVRSVKEIGWQSFSLDKAKSPLANMGQLLFEPPNVAGWPSGSNWFSTSTMLARTNFAATLAGTQKDFLAGQIGADGASAQGVLSAMLNRVTPAPMDRAPQDALMQYLLAGGTWTGTATQVSTRAAGLARLLIGSGEYQFV
jgi:uncharacterized protein (DUF1800 family)